MFITRTFAYPCAALLILSSACATEDSDQSTTVTGRVATADGSAASGQPVRAYRIADDGSENAIDDGETTTDESGRYQLTIEASADADIVLRSGDGEQMGAVAVRAGADGSVTAPPIELGNAVIVDVLLAAHASGSWHVDFEPAMVRLFIDAEAEASLHASASYASDTVQAGQTIAAALGAWVSVHGQEATSAAQADVEAALRASYEAGGELTANLDGATSEATIDAAIDAYVYAFVDAHRQADMTASDIAASASAMAEVSARFGQSISADAGARIAAAIELIRAHCVTVTVEDLAETAAASSAELLATASAELEASIEASAEAGADAQTAIVDAWISYRLAVEAALYASMELSAQAQSDLEQALADSADQLAGTLAAISLTASISATIDLMVGELVSFYLASEAQAQVFTGAGLSEADASAMVRTLAELHLASN